MALPTSPTQVDAHMLGDDCPALTLPPSPTFQYGCLTHGGNPNCSPLPLVQSAESEPRPVALRQLRVCVRAHPCCSRDQIGDPGLLGAARA